VGAAPAGLCTLSQRLAHITLRADRPHVLVLAASFPARSETFVVDHVRGLISRGAAVSVAAWEVDLDALTVIEQRYGVRIPLVRVPYRPTRHFRRLIRAIGSFRAGVANLGAWLKSPALRDATAMAAGVGSVIRQARPDLVHAHFGPVGVAAALALRRSRIPLLVNFHGFDATVVPRHSGWSTYRPLLRPGIRLIAHSRFIAERIAVLGVPVARVQMGYDADVFYPADRKNPGWQKPLRLIQVGRLVPQKGQRVSIEAMAQLRDQGCDARLCLVGAGPEAEALAHYCEVLELTSLVELAGGLTPDEVAERLRASDLMLAPSLVSPDGWQEGFGRAVIEGIGCGLPAVVFPTGGLSDTIAGAGMVCVGTTAFDLANGIGATIGAGSPQYWRDRCLLASRGRALEMMWSDYERITKEGLAATAA
jgi:glycosyltransferase involved in cell wall biosynthesis